MNHKRIFTFKSFNILIAGNCLINTGKEKPPEAVPLPGRGTPLETFYYPPPATTNADPATNNFSTDLKFHILFFLNLLMLVMITIIGNHFQAIHNFLKYFSWHFTIFKRMLPMPTNISGSHLSKIMLPADPFYMHTHTLCANECLKWVWL